MALVIKTVGPSSLREHLPFAQGEEVGDHESVTQCFNITRSKHTSEARMYKMGTKSKWHATMKPFIDGTVDAEELITFAESVCGLASGDTDEHSPRRRAGTPDELLPPP
jgi:hypothetical protein